MRKVVSLMHMSLDGLVADKTGDIRWIKMDDNVFEYYDPLIAQATTGVYGPITFNMMEIFWPGVLDDPNATGHFANHAKWYSKAEKVVFSRTEKSLDNPQANLVNSDLAEEVTKLKSQEGGDIMIFGSPRLVHSFAQQNLVDEYIVHVNPVILGEGTPMFAGLTTKIDLKLESSKQFPLGGVVLRYTR